MPTIPTIKFDPSLVTAPVLAELLNCVSRISGLAGNDIELVHEAAVRCVTAGGDLHTLFIALSDAKLGCKRRELEELCRYINRRAFSIIDRERMAGISVKEVHWLYSGAPCLSPDFCGDMTKDPQDRAHRKANGKLFDFAEGLILNGRTTWPGWEMGCRCTFRIKIPAF